MPDTPSGRRVNSSPDNLVICFVFTLQIYMNGKLKSVIDNPNAPCFNVTIPKHAKERIFTSRLTDLFPNANYLLELYAVNQYGKGDIAEHTFKTAEGRSSDVVL